MTPGKTGSLITRISGRGVFCGRTQTPTRKGLELGTERLAASQESPLALFQSPISDHLLLLSAHRMVETAFHGAIRCSMASR